MTQTFGTEKASRQDQTMIFLDSALLQLQLQMLLQTKMKNSGKIQDPDDEDLFHCGVPVPGLDGDRDEHLLGPLGTKHADVDRSGSRHIYYHQFRILENAHKLCTIYRT